jgi:hypothetical protein
MTATDLVLLLRNPAFLHTAFTVAIGGQDFGRN